MSLLGPVYVTLTPRQEALLAQGIGALQDIAMASSLSESHLKALGEDFNTLLARLGGTDLTPEQEQQVAALIAQLKASGDALGAAEAAQP